MSLDKVMIVRLWNNYLFRLSVKLVNNQRKVLFRPLKKLMKPAIIKSTPGKLYAWPQLQHDNAIPHTAQMTKIREDLKWETAPFIFFLQSSTQQLFFLLPKLL